MLLFVLSLIRRNYLRNFTNTEILKIFCKYQQLLRKRNLENPLLKSIIFDLYYYSEGETEITKTKAERRMYNEYGFSKFKNMN